MSISSSVGTITARQGGPNPSRRWRRAAVIGATTIIVVSITLMANGSHSFSSKAPAEDVVAAATMVASTESASLIDAGRPAPATTAAAAGQVNAADGRTGFAAGGNTGSTTFDPAALQGRKIIRNGSIDLRVENASATLRKAEAIVNAHGGFLADQQANYDRGSDITVVYRIPASAFDATLQGLTGLGKVISAQVSSNEVTGQVIDLESRLRSKRAAADRLRILVGQAIKPADVLAIESELANREADIESMQAQLSGLNDQVSLSTLRAHIFTPSAGPVVEPHAKPSFLSGWRRGVKAFTDVADSLAAGLGALLPFTPLLLALIVVMLVARRRVAKKTPIVSVESVAVSTSE